MPTRRYSREIALKVLFHLEFNQEPLEEAIEKLQEVHEWNPKAMEYAKVILETVMEHKEDIDSCISKASKNWRLERIGNVERCILRCASAELLYLNVQVPPKVSIDEAVEMAKEFGNEDSAKFVNGIMDFIYKNIYIPTVNNGTTLNKEGGMDEISAVTS